MPRSPRHAPPPGQRPPLSSRDVAEAAGVSQATVSRVINGQQNVRPETRRRVEAALRQLGYVPNAAARSLMTRQTRLLGLVVSNITNGFYPEIVDGITSTAMQNGYTVIVGSAGELSASQTTYVRLLVEHRVDGAILTSLVEGDVPDLVSLSHTGFPIVLANRMRPELPLDCVSLDNEAAGRIATDHLLHHGWRRTAYVGGRRDAATDRDRFAGYGHAIASFGASIDDRLVSHGEFTRAYGFQRMTELLALPEPPDAIVAADDTIALGVLDAVVARGLRPGVDVAVVGFDDIDAASLRMVALTTVSSSARAMGTAAVQLLLDRIRGGVDGPPRRLLLPAELIVRSSCGRH